MLCDKCCDSKNIQRLIKANGEELENQTTCPRCSGRASWSISQEKFIDAFARIVEHQYTPVEGPIDCFSSLEPEKAEQYRMAWGEYEMIEYKPQETLLEDGEEEWEEDVPFERMMEETSKNQCYIANKYGVDFEDVYEEYFNGSRLYYTANEILTRVLNPSHNTCINKIDEFIPKLDYEESRFFYALHNEKEIYWIDKPKSALRNLTNGLWDEYVNIIRTENRFFY